MKVFLMIGQLGLGGTEKQVALLAHGLRERGIEVAVLVMFEGGPREQEILDAGVPVVRLGFRKRGRSPAMPFVNLAAFVRLVTWLRRAKPDILHAFLVHSYVPAAPAARLARVPVLVAGRRSLGEFAEGRRVVMAVERAATRMTHLLIANAQAVAESTLRRERVPEGKVTVVYNGLPDVSFGESPPAEIDTGAPVVLCVANLKPYKGHRHLIQGVARLKHEGLGCTLLLAGDGPERAALEADADRHGIDVRFLGARTDIAALLARADVFVLPSLFEGMSNAVMEAMAAGVPVVATDVGGTGELLKGRGVLVPPADPEALAAGLRSVLTDRVLAEKYAAEARAWSREHLHVDTMVDRHVAIYRDLLAGESPCAG